MSATADDMEAALMARAKGAASPSDDMEAALIARSQAKTKTPEQKTAETQSRIRSMGGDTAGLDAGQYVYDWAKGVWTSAKNYASKKGEEIQKTGSASNLIEDAAKAVGTGLWNNVGAPLFGAGAKIGGLVSGSGTTYEQGKNAATINPSEAIEAASDVIGNVTKPAGEIATLPGNVASSIEKSYGVSPDTQAMTADLTNIAAPLAVSKLAKVGSVKVAPVEDAQTVLNKEASAQSMGSAGAALDLSKQSPEFVQAIQSKIAKGEKLNPKGVASQALGDRLPVKMVFSEGQALEDAAKISEELNRRGINPEVAVKRLNEQNQQLIDNLSAVREKYGENDFSSNHIERGQKIINSYLDYEAAKQADISAKYKALEDASQGADPIDAAGVYNDTVKNLQAKLKLTRAQQLPEFNELRQLAESGNMTFDNYHTLMQDLGRVVAGGGDEAATARIIQDSLAKMPLKPGAEALRGLRDQATAAAKERFDELRKDQAYADVVNGISNPSKGVQPDHFIDKYITGNAKTANKAQIDAIKQKFGEDASVSDAINTAVIERLKKEAGIDESGKGNFSQSKYNKYLQTVVPKLKTAVSPDLIETLSDIGEAARLAKQQPAGSYVNNSNSGVALIANAAQNAEKLNIPGAAVASKAINKYADYKANKDLKQSFEYGAGMGEKTKLSDVLKPKTKKDTEKK